MGDAINYAQQAIFNTFDLTLNSETQTNALASGANTLTSALPTNLQRIQSMYISSPSAYARDLTDYFMKIKDFRTKYPDAGAYTGTIQEWSFFTSVEFAVSSSVDLVVKIDYTKYVPLLSATSDVPTIPESFEELLLLGAKMRVYEQKEDFDYAQQFNSRYADLLEAFVTRYSTRQVEVQMVVPGARNRV